MKNIIITIITLCNTTISFAQDISGLECMDKSQAKAFSMRINDEIREPWKFLKEEVDGNYLRFYYVPKVTTGKELKAIASKGLNLADVDYYYVDYVHFVEGKDEELEIEGVSKYYFSQVKLKFLDAFKVWEALFFNGTTIEKVRNYDDTEIKFENSRARLTFRSNVKPYWIIQLTK